MVLGGSDTDNATVTGSDSGIDPTGSVTFYYCGPEVTETGCNSTSGTEFDTETLTGTSNPGTVTSADFTASDRRRLVLRSRVLRRLELHHQLGFHHRRVLQCGRHRVDHIVHPCYRVDRPG